MNPIEVNSPADPAITPFLYLSDRHLAAREGLFVVEGEFLVLRLLRSQYETVSILCESGRLAGIEPLVGEKTAVYIAGRDVLSQIVGFPFHRGVLALGARKPMISLTDFDFARQPLTILAFPEVNDVENLGGMVRNAAAFGVDAVLLGEKCCDPFARRAIRVSMGAVFKMDFFRMTGLLQRLEDLRSEYELKVFATILDEGAVPLHLVRRAPRSVLLFGNEAGGLSDPWRRMADELITIPMRKGVDSLNVSVACGIVLYHFCR
ncbi:RNA methyltransferase [candidate division KSB1 bacterium]|nr:RNA methyltransferase [candidate division KSB1 bacterium]